MNVCHYRLHFLPMMALLTLIFISGCSSTAINKNNSQEPIVNQSSNPLPEVELSQNLNQLLAQISQTQKIPLSLLETGFNDTKSITSIRKLVLPPSGTFKKNWLAYRARFIEPIRIQAGKTFLQENQEFLTQIEQQSGVPAQVIVAIIGIETIYGRQLGNFRVKDVLTTLAFDYPETANRKTREALFKDQLQELVLMCWTQAGGVLPGQHTNQGIDSKLFQGCLNQTSSYAGAIGLPQFMPGSIRKYAVDGDGDGQIDLRKNPQDAIASVAHFLQNHGWQTGMPIYFKVAPDAVASAQLLADGEPTLKYSVQELIEKGILLPAQGDLMRGGVEAQSKALIVDLPYLNKAGDTQVRFLVGLNNFLTIVQYNRSYFYAQSVAEFAEALGYKNSSIVTVPATTTADKSTEIQKSKIKPKSKSKKVKPTT
jgi:membrane-bound lytic murein transglycosylase B